MIEELIARVFKARDVAHLRHFSTDRYSEHIALSNFYDAVIEALDALVECYQGQFGLVGAVPSIAYEEGDIVGYLREEADWIDTNRSAIANESPAIENLVDALTAVYLRAIYMLERLK